MHIYFSNETNLRMCNRGKYDSRPTKDISNIQRHIVNVLSKKRVKRNLRFHIFFLAMTRERAGVLFTEIMQAVMSYPF